MTPERLASIAAYAGDLLDPVGPSGPHPFGNRVAVRSPNVVYVVCAWSGQVLYVGSTTVGVRRRFSEHLRDQVRTLSWVEAYLIPLVDHAKVDQVRRVEARVGLALGPVHNRALPRLA